MSRQSFLGDEPWDEIHEKAKIRTRIFDRLPGRRFGASLHELLPGLPGFDLHMHYGVEEIFFVLSGTPTFQNGKTEERLSPGDGSTAPKESTVSTPLRTRRPSRRASSRSRRAAYPTSSRIPSAASPG